MTDETFPPPPPVRDDVIVWFDALGRTDVARVGGKNASLGEMVSILGRAGVEVPPGFATTASAYWARIEHNRIGDRLAAIVAQYRSGTTPLHEGAVSRRDRTSPFPAPKATEAMSIPAGCPTQAKKWTQRACQRRARN